MKLFASSQQERFEHKIIALIAFVLVVVVNAMATLLPLNGKTTGEISDSYPNLFAPAGVTFAIWSVIYLMLAVYVVYQFAVIRDNQSMLKEPLIEQLNQYFIISSLFNIVWIFSWHYEVMWLSVILMIGLLASLIKCSLLLKDVKMSTYDRLAVRAPFSVYFGWITVATVANITTWLVSINWDGFGLRAGIWTVAILMITTVIGVGVMYYLRSWVYGLVVVWALAGILVKHLSTNGWNGAYPSVIVTLSILLAVTIVVVLYIVEQSLSRTKKV